MKIVTWNVNGLRKRQGEVLELLERERPDVLCLQEIKASIDQLPFHLRDVDGYWSRWHGEAGYSGVGLLIAKALRPDPPDFVLPTFDFEQRVVAADIHTPLGELTVASVYVPNGGKDYEAKLRFLESMETWAATLAIAGRHAIVCGDLNVARTDKDIHPKERKPNQVGARVDERAVLERFLSHGLVDTGRALDPDNENLFTWWAPWRSLRQKNIGWRIDYVVASAPLAARARHVLVQRDVGTSDHAPLVAEFAVESPGP
jgi:exodeoxyribonuclease III